VILIYIIWAGLLFGSVFTSAISAYSFENRLFARLWNFGFCVLSAALGLALGILIAIKYTGQLPHHSSTVLILVTTIVPGMIGAMLGEWYKRRADKTQK
jgi:hypothetical protein